MITENHGQETGEIGKEREKSLKDLASRNFAAWNKALVGRDPKKVADLYAEDASFLPTLNPEFRKGQAEAEGYFRHFLEKNPEGKVVEETVRETSVGNDGETTGFLHSGMYDFEVGEPDDRKTVEARFTFLWVRNERGEWKIAHHHSSLKPAE